MYIIVSPQPLQDLVDLQPYITDEYAESKYFMHV